MVPRVNGPGRPGPCRMNSSLNKIAVRLKRIITEQQLMKPSGYQSTTSNCVVLGGRIFLHRDHHYALVSWAKAVKDLGLGMGSVLLHADRHPDLGGYPEKHTELSAEQLFDKARAIVKELDNYPDTIPEEQFIKPAIGLRMIGKYVLIPPLAADSYEVDLPIPWEIAPIEKLLQEHKADPGRDHILDLDLDYFSKGGSLNNDINNMAKLVETHKPKIITVAFSPASSTLRECYLSIDLKACSRVIAEIALAAGLKDDFSVEVTPEERRTMRYSPK